MPNRTIREGLLSSEAVNAVSPAAEMLYVRFQLKADDFGLVELTPAWVEASCLPARRLEREAVLALIGELVGGASPLIRAYEVGGKRYGAIEKWDQRRFALKPKFPPPPWGWTHIRGGYVDPRARAEAPPAQVSSAAAPRAPSAESGGGGKRLEHALDIQAGLPADWRSFCASTRPDLNADDTWARFVDHWKAAPGTRGRKSDWLATWRNWVRNERRAQGAAARQHGTPGKLVV